MIAVNNSTPELVLYMAIGLFICLLLATLLWIYKKFDKNLWILQKSVKKISGFYNRDPLTGLPNRKVFFEHLKSKLVKARTPQQKLALFFIDLDHFRDITDTLGYSISELLIKAVAKRLKMIFLNQKWAVSRLASDQFIIMVDELDMPYSIETEAKKILALINEPFQIEHHLIKITASIGISLAPDHAQDVETLLKFAGIARHQSKKMGSNTFSYYTPDMNRLVSERKKMEDYLRTAIDKDELSIFYQPKVDISTRKIIGAEALLQWHNPELGHITPTQFIPLAEHTGLILSIGNWVLKKAAMQAATWHKAGFDRFSIAVNISAYQFNFGDIAIQVADALFESGLSSEFLELELTESLLMENIEKSLLMLRVLKTMGVKISMDDFGTGYSSLSQLKKLPIDFIKIDQSFIRSIKTNPKIEGKDNHEEAIVETIISMAKQLKLKIIAEGVETEDQFNFLKQLQCTIGQGYLFGKPMRSEEFTQKLNEHYR